MPLEIWKVSYKKGQKNNLEGLIFRDGGSNILEFGLRVETNLQHVNIQCWWLFIPFITWLEVVVHWSTGTSACPAGKFYCRNLGSKPQFIVSSHVNDRFCGKHFLLHFFLIMSILLSFPFSLSLNRGAIAQRNLNKTLLFGKKLFSTKCYQIEATKALAEFQQSAIDNTATWHFA
jgi:hypothetical protein